MDELVVTSLVGVIVLSVSYSPRTEWDAGKLDGVCLSAQTLKV